MPDKCNLLTKQKEWLGPFPCKPSRNSMSIWMAFGPHLDTEKKVSVQAKKIEAKDWIHSIKEENQLSTYGVQIHRFENLEPNTKYQYVVYVDDELWIGENLDASDFVFTTFPVVEDDIDIVMMSCHGIEAYEKDSKTNTADTWEMWRRLNQLISDSEKCYLGILGGDQVYMDDTFQVDISKFDPKKPNDMKKLIYKTYQKYWSTPEYRKVMVKLPCYLMWDDHDIIDGWGSRTEQFKETFLDKGTEFVAHKIFRFKYITRKEKWRHYGALLFQAFDEMQSCRNPARIPNANTSSFLAKLGQTAIIALDMRRERGMQDVKGDEFQILSKTHMDAIDAAVEDLENIKDIYIVSPVTLARMSGKMEFLLGSISNFMWQLGVWFGYGKSPFRVAYWASIFLAGYWALYSESINLPGVFQSFVLGAFLLFLLLGNTKNFSKFFPNSGNTIMSVIGGVILLLFGHVFFKIYPYVNGTDWSLTSILKIAQIDFKSEDSRIGTYLSLASIFYLSFIKWSFPNKLIKKKVGKNKESLSKIHSYLLVGSFLILLPLMVFNWWRGLPGLETKLENVLLLIPFALLGIATFFAFLMSILEGMGVIDEVAGLNDDVLDAWSATEHVNSLKWFKKLILKLSNNGLRRVHLLCGDIHTGGLSEITLGEKNDPKAFKFFQITSSPISYVTMPALVEKITSGVGNVPLTESRKKGALQIGEFNNLYFRSQRNFVILKTNQSSLEVAFYFEDLKQPIKHIL